MHFISLLLVLATLGDAPSANGKSIVIANPYFPVHNGITLVYQSSFGESATKYSQEGDCIVSLSESDRFKYRQTLIITEDGVYAKETYQFFRIFLFFKKEAMVSYARPLLRFPLPLLPGMEWHWEGDEVSDGDTNNVRVFGKALEREVLTTKAGKFDAIKIESHVESSSNTKNIITEWFAEGIGLIRARVVIEGGGMMGFLRDMLGYGTIEFELKEIRNQ